MTTDFFERQDEAHRRTLFLLAFFGMGVLSIIGLVYLVTAFLFLHVNSSPDHPGRLWDPLLFVAVSAIVAVVILFGSLLKLAELASGGKAVALMLNGQEIQGNTSELRERRLLNVVEEMAIASGVPMPPVYLLPQESGINAFAAGHGPGDAVVAVSAGCLTYLTRDEIQGVVGHEFSHILNGDMRLNLRVVAIIAGIVALSEIGYVLMRTTGNSRSSSDERKNDNNLFLLGVALYVIGLGGAFFGWLIQAAVSRQREYLADASAVQFTRNPEGIAGALKKIGGLQMGSRIVNARASEVSHMFLSDAFMGQRLTGLFETHPPLEVRIRRLDAQFDGSYPEVQPVEVSVEELKRPRPARLPGVLGGLPQLPGLAAAGAALGQIGTAQPRHAAYAESLATEIPDGLRDAARSPFSAQALIYCLLLDKTPEVRQTQLDGLRAAAGPEIYGATLRMQAQVEQMPAALRLPLADLTLPALRQMSPAQHVAFRAEVDALIHADNRVSLFEYCLHCVVTRYLDAAYGKLKTTVSYTAPAQVAPQTVLVLSLLAWEGQPEEPQAQGAFAAGIAAFDPEKPQPATLLPRERCDLQAFDAALKSLALAAPAVKRRVIAACAACIQADGQITVSEGELLRTVSAALGCPMPPLVGEPQG